MGEQDVAYTDDGMSLSKKKGILSFETTWVGLEGIMLSEISQRKTNILWSYLHVEPKQANKNEGIDISPRVVQHGYYR